MTNIRTRLIMVCLSSFIGVGLVTMTGCSGSRYHRSTGAYLDDKAIVTKIKTEMFADPVVKGTQVSVDSYQGKVQLSGFVDTQAQKDRAAEVARRVKGVQWVKNDIIVKGSLPGAINQAPGAVPNKN